MAIKQHVAFTWGKSVVESIKMSSLEFEQNGKKEDNSSRFEILNVSEDLGTEVKDREEQDGGYFDAMMEHNTEESAESIDSFMKKTTEKSGEGLESEIRLTEKNDSVEGTNVYGSEEDSSYNINEEIEKESRVMDCEAADIALNDVSMGLSLHDTSEGEGDDVMVSEEMEGDILSDKVIDDGMASDQENDVIKSKDDDLIASEDEDYVMAHQGSEGSELLTDDMIATEVMVGEEGRDDRVVHQEDGIDDLMEGEGTHLESVISGGGESSGSLLDTEYVDRKKEIKFVNLSDIQMKVDVVDKRAGETAVVSGESRDLGSLSDTEYLDKKQNDRKEETALGKTSPVHTKVDMLDKTPHIKHSDAEDDMTKSRDQQIEYTGESKENTVILKSEAENSNLMNEEVEGTAATRDGCDNDNPEFQDILTSEELKYNERCVESENGVDVKEPLNKTVAVTPDTTICDGEVEDEVKENKVNDRLNERLNTVECENEVRKHKTKNDEDARTDRDAEERENLGMKDNIIEAVRDSRSIAKVDDDMAQTEVVKNEDEKVRVMSRNQHKDLQSDQYRDLDESLKKASRTQIFVGKEAETDGIVHKINDAHELASAGQQPAGGPLIKKTVSNIERVKRKIEEILEKSKAEEDEFIEEIQQMKKEKTDILHKISSEMKKLKSLLVNEKQEEQK